tara:strand:- start:32954 stop:35077 length:2124 start_codon:yes stop_codon:yes gene_type:complete
MDYLTVPVSNSLRYLTVLFLLVSLNCKKTEVDYTIWNEYLGGPDRNHYSALSQITKGNISQLEIAWTYSLPDSGQMQMNPIIVDSVVYGVSPSLQAFAVHAGTGKEIWIFGDPEKVWHSTSRGVSYWESGSDKRIFFTSGPYLYALNALTGTPIITFGDSGRVHLNTGLKDFQKDKFVVSNTPGTIYEDIIIMPTRLPEGPDAPPGDIRAFNVRTGELEWEFHTIPHPGEFGYETWPEDAWENSVVGAANNWAGMALDIETGILYIPTGSAAPDFYGGHRIGENLFANSLIALDAKTGKRIWHYQFTHHDIWDRDLPAPPNLIVVERNGVKIKAVAQITKQGYIFLFDRYSGKPLFDIIETPVPSSKLDGEQSWPTQPIPVKPRPFARNSEMLTESDISRFAENREELIQQFRTFDTRSYAPPSTSPVLLFPGYDGGAEWGGAAADPDSGIVYVNSNEMAWILKMEETGSGNSPITKAANLYSTYCQTCHGADFNGNEQSGYPSLTGVTNRLSTEEITDIVQNGKAMMTGIPALNEQEIKDILFFIEGNDKTEVISDHTAPSLLPYRHSGYQKFLDSQGLPAISPPWGTLSAIDLNTGEYKWRIPLGREPLLEHLDLPDTGTENYGGPLVTENGLLFIAATKDGYFRAFDKHTGKKIWEFKLPAASFATPSTYQLNGKQYIVLACGGEKLGTVSGNQILAFSLPENN